MALVIITGGLPSHIQCSICQIPLSTKLMLLSLFQKMLVRTSIFAAIKTTLILSLSAKACGSSPPWRDNAFPYR